MVALVTSSSRASRPSVRGPPKCRTDRALNRAGVSPDSASTRCIARSRWMANEFSRRPGLGQLFRAHGGHVRLPNKR